MNRQNPYDWSGDRPAVPVMRDVLREMTPPLCAGRGVVLLGGMGMGKSVLLRQIEEQLTKMSDVAPLLFREPPLVETPQAALRSIAEGLGIQAATDPDAGEILRAYFKREPTKRAVVVIFDELDRYPAELARTLFRHLESVRKDAAGRLGILAAGGLGLFSLRDRLGSPFLSRATWVELSPFGPGELLELARPFVEAGRPLSAEVQAQILLASGGNPALVTYALERLWDTDEPTLADVIEAYGNFQASHHEFVRRFRRSVFRPELSPAPEQVLTRIQRGSGLLPRQELLRAGEQGSVGLDLDDVLRLLRAAGLIWIEGSISADPLLVRPVASLLNIPPAPQVQGGDLQEQLYRDLRHLLGLIHGFSMDFFRGEKANEKQLVPESVFSATLAIGMSTLGWRVEREAIAAAGRTDIKLRRPGTDGLAIVEVKIWGRNDYKDIQNQVESYASTDIAATAAVMVTDRNLPDWPQKYRGECLTGDAEERSTAPPLRGEFRVRATTPAGFQITTDHLLLALPRA